MGATLSLVLFPKAGFYVSTGFYDEHIIDRDNKESDPNVFAEKARTVLFDLNLPIKGQFMVSAGYAQTPGISFDVPPGQAEKLKLLGRHFSLRVRDSDGFYRNYC